MKLHIKVLVAMSFVALSTVSAFGYDSGKLNYQRQHTVGEEKRNSGAQIAEYLNQDYANTETDCGSSSEPAFLCSGVLFRGTDTFSTSYHSWDPSPASVTSGGVSFSYLRADSKYDKLAYSYNNGFIFYLYYYAPSDTNTDIDIMCAFPTDASTDNRSDKGCGEYTGRPESTPCQGQGIVTANEWYQHYVQYGSSHLSECGFTTDDNSSYNTADAFYQTILSMATISTESFTVQNELRLSTWAQGMQNSLPIQAFFYLSGSSAGLSNAQKNQKDFYNSTTNNIWVPVIALKLPSSRTDNATFTFNAGDQLIPEPSGL